MTRLRTVLVTGASRRIGAAVRVVNANLMSAIGSGTMDLIVSNPPYVPSGDLHGLQREVRDWEPHFALFAGASGLEVYARIISDAPRVTPTCTDSSRSRLRPC